MCIRARLFGKRKVLLGYPPKLVSIASVLALKLPLFRAFRKILRGLRIRAKSNLLQKGHEDREQMRDASRLFLFFPSFFFSPLFPCSFNIRNSREYPRKARVRFVSLPGKLHFEKSIFDPSLFLTRDELHTTNIYALTRGYVHRLAMNYLCPIVYDLFHDKGRIAVMEGIVMMVNFVTCALAWMYPVFGFISSIPFAKETCVGG